MSALQGTAPHRHASVGSAEVWIAVSTGLALLVALSYALIGRGVLGVGHLVLDGQDAAFPFAVAACYLVGGLLVPLRRRWLWITGLAVNTLAIVMFFALYSATPDVLLSAGGVISKSLQIGLEIALGLLLITGWRTAYSARRAASSAARSSSLV